MKKEKRMTRKRTDCYSKNLGQIVELRLKIKERIFKRNFKERSIIKWARRVIEWPIHSIP